MKWGLWGVLLNPSLFLFLGDRMKKFILLCFVLVACSGYSSTDRWGHSSKIHKRTIYSVKDVNCLAKNIYFEARDQKPKGQIAVALVTINRVKSKRFPNSICKVVEQANRKNGKLVLHKCHFSWFCDGKSDTPRDKLSWDISLLIARAMLRNPMRDFLHGATHYHRIDVDPYWNKKMLKFSTIGDHIFYIDALNR
jgi:spore germination cell wall hydrolase CwlJ-like protein|tara:strand:- start:1320 stop:1904 length:585 start_codon:yes stop_codon:yes gene_type:complete